MKKILSLFGLLLLPAIGFAQDNVSLDPEFGGRLAFRLDKKLVRGLHLNIEEEARVGNNFASLSRLHSSVAVSYKAGKQFKFGLGYALINPYNSDKKKFKNSRHRVMLDAKATMRYGDWQFSLKERMQATFRTGDFNIWQHPQPELSLKSRLMAKYKGIGHVTPYGYLELRNSLNAPVVIASYNGSQWLNEDNFEEGDAGWFIGGWNKAYLNRLRGCVGAEWKLDKSNALNFCLLADWINNYVVDANALGTILKQYTHQTGFIGQIAIQYSYSF